MTDKPILRVLRGEALDTPPAWFMRQAGRYLPEYKAVRAEAGGFLNLCYSPEKATEVTLQPIRRYGFDAAILFSDILVVPHGLGQTVGFKEGEGPVLEPVRTAQDLSAFDPARMVERLAPVYEAVSRIREALDDRTTLIGFAGAPWTVASYMVEGGSSRDYEAAKGFGFRDPDGFGQLLDLVVTATIEHLSAQIDAGAEVVQVFDSWAGALPSPQLEAWSLRPLERIVSALKDRHPDIPVILFPRGAGMAYPAFARIPGVSAVSLDTSVDVTWARDAIGPDVAIQGNLDPVWLVAGGAGLDAEVRRVREGLRGRPHIFNLGHGISQRTPPEAVARALDVLREEMA